MSWIFMSYVVGWFVFNNQTLSYQSLQWRATYVIHKQQFAVSHMTQQIWPYTKILKRILKFKLSLEYSFLYKNIFFFVFWGNKIIIYLHTYILSWEMAEKLCLQKKITGLYWPYLRKNINLITVLNNYRK